MLPRMHQLLGTLSDSSSPASLLLLACWLFLDFTAERRWERNFLPDVSLFHVAMTYSNNLSSDWTLRNTSDDGLFSSSGAVSTLMTKRRFEFWKNNLFQSFKMWLNNERSGGEFKAQSMQKPSSFDISWLRWLLTISNWCFKCDSSLSKAS